MSLLEVSRRLRNETIDRAVAPFHEAHTSVRRAILMVLATAWVLFWQRSGNRNPGLQQEAGIVLPWVLTMLCLSIGWAWLARRPGLRREEWPNLVGTVADFVGLGILISIAFNLLLPFVIFLPLACITTGARYNRVGFWAGIFGAVIVVAVSAPSGYWASRPAVAVLALAMIVGLPMTVNRLLSSLREISEAAIKARDTQTRFLAMMSHELRTPLNAIVNAAGLVDLERLPEDQRPLLELVTTNAAVLLSRVDDVLEVAAINEGAFQLHATPFDMRSTLQTVNNVVQSMVQLKEVAFSISIADDVPDVLVGDARRIEQVISNLTSNAVKYTPRGGEVRISVATTPSGSPEFANLVIEVADTGIGIPDAQKPLVFHAFHQVSQGEARSHEGVGLGLHIVQRVSERMGGALSVADRAGGGSVFTWRLRLAVAGPGVRVPETLQMLQLIQRHRVASAPRICLVIDDNPSNLEISRRILELGGHKVLTAGSGEEGLALLASVPVDVAFLDLHMPGMSGWEVLDAHRQGRGGSQATKIVILSAVTDVESQERAKAAGAVSYLQKPMRTRELLDTLVALSPGTGRGLIAGTRGSQSMASAPLDELRQLGSRADVRAFLESVWSGIEKRTLELCEAVAKGDVRLVSDACHALKNEFENIGDGAAAAACSRVSEAVRAGQDGGDELTAVVHLSAAARQSLMAQPEMTPAAIPSLAAAA